MKINEKIVAFIKTGWRFLSKQEPGMSVLMGGVTLFLTWVPSPASPPVPIDEGHVITIGEMTGDFVQGDKISGDKIAGDKIETQIIQNRDEQDRETIAMLNAAMARYEKQLREKETDNEQLKLQLADMEGALNTALEIGAQGGVLAEKARALLQGFIADPGGAHLGAQFDALIAEHEAGPVQDLVRLYLGRGAWAYHEDTRGALAAYTRAAQLAPDNLESHIQIGRLNRRLGDLEAAQNAYQTVYDLSLAAGDRFWRAAALGSLGVLAKIRGDLDEAERLYNQALNLFEALGHKEGIAIAYGNLGRLAITRGDLAEAARFYNQALNLFEALGHKEGMASAYTNLGVLAKARGDLEEAERLYNQALGLYQELGRKEGMAINYLNLGTLAHTSGDLEEAERLYNQSLRLDKELGRKEGMAITYTNLGILAATRGDLVRAAALWRDARDLYVQIGAAPMAAKLQSWLDALPPALHDAAAQTD